MGAGGLTVSGYLACLPLTQVTRNHALKCKDGEVGEREGNQGEVGMVQQTAVLYIHPPHPSQAEHHPISGWRGQVPPSFHCLNRQPKGATAPC